MAISKTKKSEIVKQVSDGLNGAKAVVFVNFHGLSVALATELRKLLRAAGVEYYVAKKTLLRRALEGRFQGDVPALEGEVALAYDLPGQNNDSLAPAQKIYYFGEQHKGLLQILGGVYESRYLNAQSMIELAQIPSREVLLGKLVNLLNSPIQRLVLGLNEISKLKADNGKI